ncbi:hypothetical protein D9M71_515260 [compost metagenome]
MRWVTEHKVQHALGHTRIVETAHQLDHCSRSLLWRLDDDAAASSQSPCYFAYRLIDREVPRCKSGYRTDWLAHHQLAYRRIA